MQGIFDFTKKKIKNKYNCPSLDFLFEPKKLGFKSERPYY